MTNKLLPTWISISLTGVDKTKDSKMETNLLFFKTAGDVIIGEIRQTKDSEKNVVLA